jgi:hypothetical protein
MSVPGQHQNHFSKSGVAIRLSQNISHFGTAADMFVVPVDRLVNQDHCWLLGVA